MRSKNITFYLYIVCLVFNNKVQSQIKNVAKTESLKKLVHSDYTLDYTSDWELNQSGQMGTSFILFSQLESDTDKFKENINLVIQDLTGYNLNLDKYIDVTLGQIKSMISNPKINFNQRIKGNNGGFHKLVYSGNQGLFNLTFEQYIWVIKNRAFILTFTTEQEKFEKFKLKGEQILNSFILN